MRRQHPFECVLVDCYVSFTPLNVTVLNHLSRFRRIRGLRVLAVSVEGTATPRNAIVEILRSRCMTISSLEIERLSNHAQAASNAV